MAENGTFSANGSTEWLAVEEHGHVHVACVNTFGGGTIAIEQRINDTAYSVLDGSDVAITKTAAFDEVLYFGAGDRIRLTLTGSTSPDLHWIISGPVTRDY